MASFPIDLAHVPEHVQKAIANHLLETRPARLPNHRAELRATTNVITALLETPDSVLQKLALAVMQVTGADSAGVSLAGREDGARVFLWQAAGGLFDRYLGSVVKYDESPCGSVVDADATMLMVEPASVYPTAALVQPPMREALMVPFHVGGRAVGTVWAISQSSKAFDAEDARLVRSLSKLAALAYQVLVKMGDLALLSRTVQLGVDDGREAHVNNARRRRQ
jgi:transcriptional regulator with GAF, ATPase, and Fis domain